MADPRIAIGLNSNYLVMGLMTPALENGRGARAEPSIGFKRAACLKGLSPTMVSHVGMYPVYPRGIDGGTLGDILASPPKSPAITRRDKSQGRERGVFFVVGWGCGVALHHRRISRHDTKVTWRSSGNSRDDGSLVDVDGGFQAPPEMPAARTGSGRLKPCQPVWCAPSVTRSALAGRCDVAGDC